MTEAWSRSRRVIVVGAGVMGAAAAWWLTRRGADVVVLDRFERGHARGSSHGGSRIFRLAYDDVDYVRLAREAQMLWREAEDDVDEELLQVTGGLDHGDHQAVEALTAALCGGGARHEMLTAVEAAERWPGLRFEGAVLHQPDAGCLRSDAAVEAFLRTAERRGAEVRFSHPVEAIEVDGSGVRVRTPGAEWSGGVAIVAAGAWAGPLLSGLVPLPDLEVTEEQVLHFRPRDPQQLWPSFIHRRQPPVYGLRTPGEGVKVAEHHSGRVTEADNRWFLVDRTYRERVQRYVSEWLPGLHPDPVTEKTCLYTSTPSEDFVIDRAGPLVVAAGFSGHGFKFAPLVGRMLADLAAGETQQHARFTFGAHRCRSRSSHPR